jgi:hypothetical protein
VARINRNTKPMATRSLPSWSTGPVAYFLRVCYAASVMALIAVPSSDIQMLRAESAGEPTIYYLSPQVLTRTRMTPDRLRRDGYRRENAKLPRQEIEALATRIRSAQHDRAGERISQYDFRLCVSSESGPMWFSANGRVAYFNEQAFLLSPPEVDAVLKVFSELDSILYLHNKER